MTKLKQIYKCEVCGNIVEVIHAGAGELVCCGQPMDLLIEKNKDEGQEKHIPIIEKTANRVKVKVGAVNHPMENGHYIEWIEIAVGEASYRKFLSPGQAPEAEFPSINEGQIKARIYCNIHGLWKN